MLRKKPRSVILMIAVVIWRMLQELSTLLSYRDTIDYSLFSHLGAGDVFFVAYVPLLLLDALTLRFLYRPAPAGFWIALTGVALSTLYNFLVTFMGMGNVEVVRDALIRQYSARGITLGPETVKSLGQANIILQGIYWNKILIVCYLVGMALLLFSNAAYFYGDEEQSEGTH